MRSLKLPFEAIAFDTALLAALNALSISGCLAHAHFSSLSICNRMDEACAIADAYACFVIFAFANHETSFFSFSFPFPFPLAFPFSLGCPSEASSVFCALLGIWCKASDPEAARLCPAAAPVAAASAEPAAGAAGAASAADGRE